MISVPDIGIAVCSMGLVVFMLPTLFSRKAMVPRKTSSLPVAFFLSMMIPFFYMEGLYVTCCTLSGQAAVWWLIVKFRPIRAPVETLSRDEKEEMVISSLEQAALKRHASCEKDSDGHCIEENHA